MIDNPTLPGGPPDITADFNFILTDSNGTVIGDKRNTGTPDIPSSWWNPNGTWTFPVPTADTYINKTGSTRFQFRYSDDVTHDPSDYVFDTAYNRDGGAVTYEYINCWTGLPVAQLLVKRKYEYRE